MLLHQHPALDFITWQGLVIVDGVNTEDDPTITQEQYIIQDGKSCKKYIYWDKSNPYVLKDSNEWVNSTSTIKLIYINDNGEGTEVPQSDMNYYYTDKSSGSGGGLLIGKMMGRFDEIDGKFFTITEDIDGIKETLGINGEVGSDGSITDRLNQLEKNVEGNKTTISQITTLYNNDKITEELIDRINIGFLDIMTTLSEYEDTTTDAMKDLEINDNERTLVREKMALLNERLTELNECHELIKGRIDNETNADAITQLDSDNIAMNNAINNLNSNVTNVISSNTVPTSAITTVLAMFAQASTRIKNYQQTLRDVNVLGLGGVITSNIQTIKETATEYNRTISSLETIVNGENGLTTQVANNSTAINQNAETIRLSCMKYNMTTAEITVGDSLIKLDAGKVLMTGTLTWDSLDEEAKTNLKGQDGTNATAEYVMLSGDQIFKYDANGNPENLSVTLRAETFNITNPTYTWSYKQQNSTEYVTLDNTFLIYTLTHDNSIWGGNNSITIRVVVGWSGSSTTVSDEMTIVKLYDGAPGIDGNDGDNAQYVKIIGDQYFKYGDDITEAPTPASITLTAESFNITSTNSHWYYKDANEVWQELTAYAGRNTLTVNHSDNIFVERYATIRYSIGTIYDVFTLVKLVDGADGYSIILSNENHSVPCEADGTYDTSALDDAYTTIAVFKGTNEVSFNLTKIDTGCTSTYNTSTKTLQITRLNENKATVDLSIIVSGKTFKKTMTITKALRGEQGLEGNGLEILGEFNSVDDLPTIGNPGDAYMINGLIYIWSSNTNSWGDGVSIRGEQGIPGRDGVDGQTTYLHIKYSNDGITFTGNNGEDLGDWMGQYVDFVIDDSSNFNDYRWMKIVGEDGEHGIVANLTNDSHVVPVNSDGSLGASSLNGCESTIQLSYNGNLLTNGVTYSYTKSDSVTGTWNNGTFTVTNLTDYTGYVDLKATFNGVTYTKRFTISKNIDGITFYTWIRYADDANGTNISDDPTGKTYIGIGYNKLIEQESDDPTEYMWSKIMGDKGDTGEPGADGIDGTTYYTWIKYSDNSTGNPCYDTPISTTAYIGIAVNQTTPIESSDYTLYTWMKFKGEDGTSVKILDSYETEEELNNAHPSGNNEGDGYIIGTDLYIWTGTAFKNVGKIQGDNGRTSYFHVKYSNDGGLTFTDNDGEDTGMYMGTYVDFEEADSKDVSKYTWILVKGADGTNGINGADGVDGQDGVSILWQGTLMVHPANPQNGWAYYNSLDRKSYTYRDGAWYQMTVDGKDGVDGNDGRDGTDGLSIDYRGEMSNPPSNPIKNWVYRDSDNGIVYIYTGTAWEVMTYDGTDGADGTNGTNGADGADGADGLSVFITYHDNLTQPSTPTGNGTSNGWHTNCTDAVVWMSQKVAMTSTEGTWGTPVKIKGQDGKDGTSIRILGTYNSESELNSAHPSGNTEGDSYIVNGNLYVWNGSNFSNTGKFQGDSSYLHIKYSNDGGKTFTANNGESVGEYIGIYTDNIEQDSTNVSDYKWSKIEGSDGEDAYTVNLSNDSHVFTADANGNIISDTSIVIVVSAYKGTTPVTPTIGTLPSATGITLRASGVNITVTVTNSLGQSGVLKIPITVDGNQFTKEFSYAKVTCGANGSDGADAYTVLLTNESDIFVCENNGNITSAITKTTRVLAYRGTTPVTPTIGSLPSINGLTLSRSGTTVTIVANTGTSLASSGSFDIPITVDGILFTKTFSWAKSFKGANGADGADGSADLPSWITDWDNNKTTINGTTVLAPKIFAGSVSGNLPTGVAIGTNVFGTSGTYSNISGIAGYKNGTKTYHLSTDGNILIGNSSGKHISWDGSTLEVVADKIMLGNSAVASQESIDTAINNLEIGGKNFVRNSNFANNDANWSLHTDVTIDENKYMDEGGASLKISKSGLSSDAWTGATQTIIPSYFANDEYTVSFWYYLESKSGLDGNICLELKGTNSSGNQVGISTAYVTPANAVVGTWTRVYATIKGSANLGNVYAYPYINRNGTVWITNIQVERGNKITDWSPNYYDSSDSLSQMQGDIVQLIEDSRTYLQIDDNGVSIVSQGQNVAIKTEGEIDAIVEEFNNRFTTLENGDGFAMIFDQKYAEYGVGEAITTSRQITDHIDFSSGAIKLYGDSTNFSLTIAQDRMSFQQSGYDIAWMSTDTLYIRDGEFTNSLILGNFKWIPRENGNLSFIHI